MGLEKAIKHGKEKRKPYRKSKAFDASCRNHGHCPRCYGNRKYVDQKLRVRAEEEIAPVDKANRLMEHTWKKIYEANQAQAPTQEPHSAPSHQPQPSDPRPPSD